MSHEREGEKRREMGTETWEEGGSLNDLIFSKKNMFLLFNFLLKLLKIK